MVVLFYLAVSLLIRSSKDSVLTQFVLRDPLLLHRFRLVQLKGQ